MNKVPENSKWISVLELQNMFANARSMAIVGSASSVLQWNNGDYIDSHDVVVRFNRTVVDGMEDSIGRRTDVIVANDSNSLSKAPSPEFTSKPRCVVAFVKTNSIGARAPDERQSFLDWVGSTPLFFCPGPEITCCDVPARKRGFSMGTYALHALPYFLNIQSLFVTGFTMFGQSSGGTGHHTKKPSRASMTWHDADLERYVAANTLGNHTCNLTVTPEVAEFMAAEGFDANIRGGESGTRKFKADRGVVGLSYMVGRVGKLLLTSGYHLRRKSEQWTIAKPK